MKYLERFNFFKKKKSLDDVRSWYKEYTENLADCLYEIFDEFNIPEVPGSNNHCYWRIVGEHHIEIYAPSDINYKLYNRLITLKPTIEKRIKHPILIECQLSEKNGVLSFSRLIEIFFKEKSEDKIKGYKGYHLVDEGIFNIFKKKEKIDLYKKVEYEDILEFKETHNTEEIAQSDIKMILKNKKCEIYNPAPHDRHYKDAKRHELRFLQKNKPSLVGIRLPWDKYCELTKFNDEWFTLETLSERTQFRPQGITRYFICDTIEGVIQALKENK